MLAPNSTNPTEPARAERLLARLRHRQMTSAFRGDMDGSIRYAARVRRVRCTMKRRPGK